MKTGRSRRKGVDLRLYMPGSLPKAERDITLSTFVPQDIAGPIGPKVYLY
jgi:hypothetical protein